MLFTVQIHYTGNKRDPHQNFLHLHLNPLDRHQLGRARQMCPSQRPNMKTMTFSDQQISLRWRWKTTRNIKAVSSASFTLTSSYSLLPSACRIIDLEALMAMEIIKWNASNAVCIVFILYVEKVHIRFPWGGGDLKTVASVFTLHSHDRAVVQVQHHAPRHRPPRLTHEVPPLGEEIQSVPRCGHQPGFTEESTFLKSQHFGKIMWKT